MSSGRAARPHIAHAPEWAWVIQQAYGHTPLYLSATHDSATRCALPAFVIRRPFGRTVVASMPFLDGGGPCGVAPEIARHLVTRLIEHGRAIGAATLELRSSQPLDLPFEARRHKVNLVLSLPVDGSDLWRRLDGSVRNQVRKAERAGLVIDHSGTVGLDDFYDIFAARMRDLGSPVHGRQFFRAILDAFGDRAQLILVRKDADVIGGLVALRHDDTMTVPWAACRHEYFRLCPNMLLYWDAIRAAQNAGLRRFDFGRSTRGSGTYQFKRQWGAEDEPLYWYSVPLDGGHAIDVGASRLLERFAAAWRHMPLPLTRHLGPHLRRYPVQ